MKERKEYIAPTLSVTEIKTEDIIMISTLSNATFSGKEIGAGKVYEIE